MDFDWDDAKDAANLKKHGLSFDAASRVFGDPWSIDEEDFGAVGEQRFKKIGMVADRLAVVIYTFRGEAMRIISARKAERHEKRQYHKA